MTFALANLFMILVFWRPQEWLLPWLFGLPMLDAIVAVAVLSMMMEADQKTIHFPRNAPQLYLIPGLWVAAVMSHVAHFYFQGMMDTMVPVFKFTFFTFLLFCVIDRPSRLRTVGRTFVVMASVMAVHALLQIRRGYGFGGQWPMYTWTYHGFDIRTTFFGIFGDPNDLAQILATSIPFAFAITKKRTIFSFLLGCGITYLLVLGVLSTNSRGGLVALIAGGTMLVALMLPARWLPTVLVICVVGGLLACPFSAGFLEESAHDRVVFWGTANYVFKRNPIFGVGYGMWYDMVTDQASHNAFVVCYTELGVFGYWFWFSIVLLAVLGAMRSMVALEKYRTGEEAWVRRFAGVAVAAMVGYMASAYFLTRAFVYPTFFLGALLGAIPYVTHRMLPKGHPPLINGRKDVLVLGTIASLGSIVYIYISIIFLNKAFYG